MMKLKILNFKLKIPAKSRLTRGMTLFIAVTVMAILLFISFAVVNIAIKSSLFASSGRDSQFAFYAADSGLECALYWDTKFETSKFDPSADGSPISCGGYTMTSIGAPTTIQGTTTSTHIGGGGSIRTNYAWSANGGIATPSSQLSSYYPASSAINDEKRGVVWGGSTGGWRDGTPGVYNDWLKVSFSGPKNINEIDVYTLANSFIDPADTDLSDNTFTLYGIRDFKVQYSTNSGGSWTTISDVVGNNLIWRKFTFSPISNVTDVQIEVSKGSATINDSRIVEIEAYGEVAGVYTPSTFGFVMDKGLLPNRVPHCAIVTVAKNGANTTIKSRGYNTCDFSNSRRIERGVEMTY